MKYILLSLGLLTEIFAFAGTNCEQKPLERNLFSETSTHAMKLLNFLNKYNPDAAIIARIGSDSSKYGVKYTHAAFVIKENNSWNVIHLLNDCGTNTSHIYNQGLLNFYLDDLYKMDVQIILPIDSLQKRIKNGLIAKRFLSLHCQKYSMLSYPGSTQYQNSNQWILESLACAISGEKICSRESSQSLLARSKYEPFKIKLGAIENMFVSVFKANINFSGYPANERADGLYSVVTVSSILDYLTKHKLVGGQYVIE